MRRIAAILTAWLLAGVPAWSCEIQTVHGLREAIQVAPRCCEQPEPWPIPDREELAMQDYEWLKVDASVIGKRVGDRTAIGPTFRTRRNGVSQRYVVVRCSCGQIDAVHANSWERGKKPRCLPCAKRMQEIDQSQMHINIPGYNSWKNMNARCHNPRHPRFASWGGRGISVCPEWRGKGGFERFIEHIGPKPSPSHSIDRIDNDGDYEPGNVRWADRFEQANNTRKSVHVTISGVTKSISEWARECGLHPQTVYTRYYSGARGEELIA